MRVVGVSALFLVSRCCDLSDPASCDASPIVSTAAGPVQGFDRVVEGQTVSTFFSLPFAQPPVGALRFHYPQPDQRTWTEPYRALTASAACPQQGGGAGSEDCLYLNVFAPRTSIGGNGTDLLPTMFWIFGGGFTIGDAYVWTASDDMMQDGARLAGRHDLVVVTHNYRLNTLGFNTWTTGPNGQTGTQAMEDQRFAMKWTHANINGFGGNPSKVTLFGESAGAFSIMFHLVSAPSWPYFSQAIMESGISELSWFFQDRDFALDLFDTWADAVGCPIGAGRLSCLQALSHSNFTDAPAGMTGRSPAFPTFPVGPVIDGNEHGLLDMPATLVQAGKHHNVPLILGSNKDGGTVFEPIVTSIVPGANIEALSDKDVQLVLDWAFTTEDQAKIRKMYHANDYGLLNLGKNMKMVARVMRDLGFMCSDRLLARQWRGRGLDAFLYTFSFNFGLLDSLLPVGDFHGAELPFVWRDILDLVKKFPTGGNVQWMADIVSCQWATFAHTGTPNGAADSSLWPRNCETVHGKVKAWPVFSDDECYYSLQASHIFGGPQVGALRANNKYPDDERASNAMCDMWDTISYPWHNKTLEVIF